MDGPPPPAMDDAHGAAHAHAANSPQVIDEPLALVTVKSANPRKRKQREDGQPAQPRRLTRSHEACARCRRKKSKCDSKHPSCSACLAAGVECVQEDRYRQTLKPRGYTDLLEAQIDKCAALLNKFIPGFKLEYLDYHLSNYGVVPPQPDGTSAQFITAPFIGAGVDAAHLQSGLGEYDPNAVPQYPGGPAYPAGVDPTTGMHESILNATAGTSYEQPVASGSRAVPKAKGNDPMANDVSSTFGLVKAFGVSQKIAKELKPDTVVSEDMMGGIPAVRDAPLSKPHDPAAWIEAPVTRSAIYSQQTIPLPRDRSIADQVLTSYFTDLNPYRPIFDELEVREKLDILYMYASSDPDVRTRAATGKYHDVLEDSGFLCCVYLIFALGTLCMHNRKVHAAQTRVVDTDVWPSHEELYGQALTFKLDLQNSVTTLQALYALHWYLSTERNGKALWRLVGSMVRLAIELGLHHDPRDQGDTFTPEECQLRMRLWITCLLHDRSTSIIFGRPLSIQRADFNTPPPTRLVQNPEPGTSDPIALFSEHFELGSELLHIQGDVVNSLYRPGKLTGEQVVLRAIEIERSLEVWRKKMPAPYQKLFTGSKHLDRQGKVELVVENVTMDRGVTVLKYGVLRMCLLRAVFNNKLVSAHVRHKALHDAVITAHNVLSIQAHLTTFPESHFFTSPVPVQVAVMIILFAAISKVETLAWGLAKEDILTALRLSQPRRSLPIPPQTPTSGVHALIHKLAVKVYGATIDTSAGSGPLPPPMLIDEMYWLPSTILTSDRPPRIEDVWNQPAPGDPDSQPLPVGLGGEWHELKTDLGPNATLSDQQAQFEAATEGTPIGSVMDIDRPANDKGKGIPNPNGKVSAAAAPVVDDDDGEDELEYDDMLTNLDHPAGADPTTADPSEFFA